MNEVEREIIILNSAWEMINDMVNWSVFVKHDRVDQIIMRFSTGGHGRLFAILLTDFLSEVRAFNRDPIPLGLLVPPSNARPADRTFLFHLRQVCTNPMLGEDVTELNDAVEKFAAWLETKFVAKGVNLTVIDIVADLRVTRYRYIKMCGDIGKHNLARLSANVGHLRDLLAASGHQVSEQDAYLAIQSFYSVVSGRYSATHALV